MGRLIQMPKREQSASGQKDGEVICIEDYLENFAKKLIEKDVDKLDDRTHRTLEGLKHICPESPYYHLFYAQYAYNVKSYIAARRHLSLSMEHNPDSIAVMHLKTKILFELMKSRKVGTGLKTFKNYIMEKLKTNPEDEVLLDYQTRFENYRREERTRINRKNMRLVVGNSLP